jgi:DNA-binding HxlR family transcriptional regulator
MAGEPTAFCPRFRYAIEIVGRRWTGAVIRALNADVRRFGDLAATVPGISDRLLSERLKELEAEGIVRRLVSPEPPTRIHYRLTTKGVELAAALAELAAWADRWVEPETAGAVPVARLTAGAARQPGR